MNPNTDPAPKEITCLARSMTPAAFTRGTKAPRVGAGGWFPVLGKSGLESGNPSSQDRAFIAMLDAYRPYGGLSRLLGLTAGGHVEYEGRESVVGKLVDEGALFGFHWHDDVWIPLFQFDMPGPKVALGPQRITAQLGRGFDGWVIASWFVRPNAWLENHSPIECLSSRLPQVLEAAARLELCCAGLPRVVVDEFRQTTWSAT
ncbi:hypothetical protein [Rhodoferax sp. PAMC 29310]|uniref:hypothetical protein n=1 Tax=Rhodoferax sp. PAMC 29310 TaxID=2822760 RepID=UPI001B32645B|nr:hypothetical protein [Rhodoferax sp. PAMC 29310]